MGLGTLSGYPTEYFEASQTNFGALNQKSAMISMCKIHNIYIDSERFRQIHRKM